MTKDKSTTGWFSDEAATFGDRLAGAREAVPMTQKQLADRLGVKHSTLRKWEEDLAEPRANRLQMLAGMLGVSLSWLLTGAGEGPDGPADEAEIPADISAVLTEIRTLRSQMEQAAKRMGQLEKRLRAGLLQM